MTEQQPDDPRQADQQDVRQAHEQQEAGQSRRDTRWGKILMPLTVIAFLVVFIAVMLIIYNIAQ